MLGLWHRQAYSPAVVSPSSGSGVSGSKSSIVYGTGVNSGGQYLCLYPGYNL